MAFTDLPKNHGRHAAMEALFGSHIFDQVCDRNSIQHCLTKPYHPWTRDEVEQPFPRISQMPLLTHNPSRGTVEPENGGYLGDVG